ncbi:MAG: hypothetical protein SFV54_07055 [Bryobacteraceae bacterium]|nr:hypothetical protein [Bryobacteraceae bacterium]
MAVLKSRSRLVTFRLSTDEYEDLKRVCIEEGARSISDFARAAVLYRVQTRSATKASLGDDLATLSSRLEELDSALKDLSGRIARVLGSANEQRAAQEAELRDNEFSHP